MSPLDRAFANWYSDSTAGEVSDSIWFGIDRSEIVSDDAVDMNIWRQTHTFDGDVSFDGLWGSTTHIGPDCA